MSKKTSDWEKEFERRFADFITSGLWYTPVREFIRQTVAKEKMELIERIKGMKENKDFKYWSYEKIDAYLCALDDVISALKSEEKEEVGG